MKKLLLALFCIAFFNFSFSQIAFFENFEGTFPGQFSQNYVTGTLNWTANGGNMGNGANNYYNGATGANFYYAGYSGDETELVSPNINLAGGNYTLEFWHIQGDWLGDQNTTTIHISTNGGTTWVLIDSITGDVPAWTKRTYNLNSFATTTSTTRIKFKGFIDYGYSIGLDDIKIFQPYPFDISVIAFNAPKNGCGLTANENVSVEVANFGSDTAKTYDVKYRINGGTYVSETSTIQILPGDTITYNFTTTANLSTSGLYTLDATTFLAADSIKNNDTLKNYLVEHIAPGTLVWKSTGRVNIPDDDSTGINSEISACGLPNSLDGCFAIKSLTIDSIIHTWASDLNIFLISPWNDTLEVSTGNGGSGDDYMNAVFIDTSNNYIQNYTTGGITQGVYHIEDSVGLTKLHTGQDPNGIWKLWAFDDAGGDVGTIEQWTLEFEYIKPLFGIGNDTTICTSGSAFLFGPFGPYTYSWSTGDSSQSINFNGSMGVGTYPVYLTLTDTTTGCFNTDTLNITVQICAGISDVNSPKMEIFPNPVNDILNINLSDFSAAELEVNIISTTGQKLKTFKLYGNSNHALYLSGLAKGTYIIEVKSEENFDHQTFIKQ